MDSAAIASPYAAELYGMRQLRKSVEDEEFNFTRFILLGHKAADVQGPSKTSVIFSLRSAPGALFKALSVFALRDIDLTKIESRPSRRKAWEYYFYLDLVGSAEEDHVRHALDHLGEITNLIKILGSYPMHLDET
jgi:prephenate dehydratase